MAKSATDTLVAKIDADISRLRDMREYVLNSAEAEPATEPKPKRGRKKKGLPTEPQGV